MLVSRFRFNSPVQEYLSWGWISIPLKVEALNGGKSYTKHISPDEVKALVEKGAFGASTDFSRVA